MYTEQKSLNNQAMTLVADTTSESTLAVTQPFALIKPNLQLGSTGQAVKELEQLLFHWGYYFGLKGLSPDGIVGFRSWHALSKLPH